MAANSKNVFTEGHKVEQAGRNEYNQDRNNAPVVKKQPTQTGFSRLNMNLSPLDPYARDKNSQPLPILKNSVSRSDVARLRNANQMKTPPMNDGGFGAHYLGNSNSELK